MTRFRRRFSGTRGRRITAWVGAGGNNFLAPALIAANTLSQFVLFSVSAPTGAFAGVLTATRCTHVRTRGYLTVDNDNAVAAPTFFTFGVYVLDDEPNASSNPYDPTGMADYLSSRLAWIYNGAVGPSTAGIIGNARPQGITVPIDVKTRRVMRSNSLVVGVFKASNAVLVGCNTRTLISGIA